MNDITVHTFTKAEIKELKRSLKLAGFPMALDYIKALENLIEINKNTLKCTMDKIFELSKASQ